MGISYEEAHQIVVEANLKKFTDNDLLMELRRRGRFKRIDYKSTVQMMGEPDRDPPESYLYPRMLSEVGREIGEKIALGDVILPGLKKDRHSGRFGRMFEDRYTIPLNFVVEKK